MNTKRKKNRDFDRFFFLNSRFIKATKGKEKPNKQRRKQSQDKQEPTDYCKPNKESRAAKKKPAKSKQKHTQRRKQKHNTQETTKTIRAPERQQKNQATLWDFDRYKIDGEVKKKKKIENIHKKSHKRKNSY